MCRAWSAFLTIYDLISIIRIWPKIFVVTLLAIKMATRAKSQRQCRIFPTLNDARGWEMDQY